MSDGRGAGGVKTGDWVLEAAKLTRGRGRGAEKNSRKNSDDSVLARLHVPNYNFGGNAKVILTEYIDAACAHLNSFLERTNERVCLRLAELTSPESSTV